MAKTEASAGSATAVCVGLGGGTTVCIGLGGKTTAQRTAITAAAQQLATALGTGTTDSCC